MTAVGMGCGGGTTTDSGPGDSGPGDTATDSTPADTAPATHEYVYVLDQVTIEQSTDMLHNGFNIDNLFTQMSSDPNNLGCMQQDFFSLYDNDQHCPTTDADGHCTAMPNPGCPATSSTCQPGVDNQLPQIADAAEAANQDIRMRLSDAVTTNKFALIIRVSGITDDMNSQNVTVRFYHAYPTFTSGCNSVPMNGSYSIAADSLMPGATSPDQAKFQFTGTITMGRLAINTTSTSMLSLSLPVGGFNLDLVLNSPQMRFNVAATGLSNGSLGGWVSGDAIVNDVAMLSPSNAGLVRMIIGNLVDIRVTDPTTMMSYCVDMTTNPARLGGISLGLGLHGVPATISMSTPIAAMQAAGTCGAPTPDGGTPNG